MRLLQLLGLTSNSNKVLVLLVLALCSTFDKW